MPALCAVSGVLLCPPAGSWRTHCAQQHMYDAWAVAQKLERSYMKAYTSMPYTTCPPVKAGMRSSCTSRAVPGAAHAASSKQSGRELRYPCPIGCAAHTMQGGFMKDPLCGWDTVFVSVSFQNKRNTHQTLRPVGGQERKVGQAVSPEFSNDIVVQSYSAFPQVATIKVSGATQLCVCHVDRELGFYTYILFVNPLFNAMLPHPRSCAVLHVAGWEVPGHVLQVHWDWLVSRCHIKYICHIKERYMKCCLCVHSVLTPHQTLGNIHTRYLLCCS